MAAKKTVITQGEYEILAGFRHTLRLFLHFSEKAARAAGVTPQQHQALLAIRGFPGPGPISVAEFAGRLQIRHHSAVGLVDRLVKQKLAARIADEKDRRRINIALTARGRKVLEKLSALHKEQLLHLIPELSGALGRLSVAP